MSKFDIINDVNLLQPLNIPLVLVAFDVFNRDKLICVTYGIFVNILPQLVGVNSHRVIVRIGEYACCVIRSPPINSCVVPEGIVST